MALSNTAMVVIIVAVVIVLGIIVYWLGSGCKRDSFTSQSAAQAQVATAAQALAAQSQPPPTAQAPTPVPPSPPQANGGVTTRSISREEAANIKPTEIGDVQTMTMPMQTIDSSANEQTLTQGNTHYILRGSHQKIILPYDANGNATIAEDFVITQQMNGPSIIVGANNNVPRPTSIKMNQSFFVQITQQSNGKRIYVLQQA